MSRVLRLHGVDVDTTERRTPEGMLFDRANDADDVRGLKPWTSCFACAHLSTLSDACRLLARATKVATIEAIIEHRASTDPHAECRSFEVAAPDELERRRRRWGGR